MNEDLIEMTRNLENISKSNSDKLFLEISAYYELVHGEKQAISFKKHVTSREWYERAREESIFDVDYFCDIFNYVKLSLGMKAAKDMLSSILRGHWLNEEEGTNEEINKEVNMKTKTSEETNEISENYDTIKRVEDLRDLVPLLMGLSLDLKTLHWNWSGKNFLVYHELLDGWSNTFSDRADDLAEMLMGSGNAGLEGISCTANAIASMKGLEGAPLVSRGEKHNNEFLSRILTFYMDYIEKALEVNLHPAHEDFLVGLLREMMTMRSHVTPRLKQ